MGELLGAPEVSSTNSIPTGFYSLKLWGLIFLALEPWAGWSGVGLGVPCSRDTPPDFYPPYVAVGPLCHISAPLHISSLPTHLDECGFFNSLIVGLTA